MASTGTSIEIAACKPAESGAGMVLRVVERRGGRGTVRITLPEGCETARAVDLHENPLEEEALEPRDGVVDITLDPYQIRTILMR